MRLIDADALKQAIEDKRCADCPDNALGIRCAACQWDDAIGLIDDAPEAKRALDLDALVDELEYIMSKTESSKDPDAFLRYATARNMKVWLMRQWGEQTGEGFHGWWIKRHDGKTICSVCWMPKTKNISELNGCCVGCGAVMDGGSVCT